MQREIDCLIAGGTENPAGPQHLTASTILALAQRLTARGCRTAILTIDRDIDPALVARDSSDGIDIYRSAQPRSTLPALSFALGQPRLLILPHQLATYDVLQTPGLEATWWLGEDDLGVLAEHWLQTAPRLWADSDHVAAVASRLTGRAIEAVMPPLGSSPDHASLPAGDSACIAVVGARPRDGIALTLSLARLRPDLRFLVIDWPRLTPKERHQFFAQAADCGNIDWRRPDGPAALIAALTEARVILVPAMEPIGHRDWICQMRRAGRHMLGSDLGAVPSLIGDADRILPAGAPAETWLREIDRLRRLPATADIVSHADRGYDVIAERFLRTES